MDKLGRQLMELEISINPNMAEQFGVKVCVSNNNEEETVIYYDKREIKLKVDTRKSGVGFGRKIIEKAPLALAEGESLELRVFVDRSIIEVCAHDR